MENNKSSVVYMVHPKRSEIQMGKYLEICRKANRDSVLVICVDGITEEQAHRKFNDLFEKAMAGSIFVVTRTVPKESAYTFQRMNWNWIEELVNPFLALEGDHSEEVNQPEKLMQREVHSYSELAGLIQKDARLLKSLGRKKVIVLITGPSGSGKTFLGERIAKLLNKKVLQLDDYGKSKVTKGPNGALDKKWLIDFDRVEADLDVDYTIVEGTADNLSVLSEMSDGFLIIFSFQPLGNFKRIMELKALDYKTNLTREGKDWRTDSWFKGWYDKSKMSPSEYRKYYSGKLNQIKSLFSRSNPMFALFEHGEVGTSDIKKGWHGPADGGPTQPHCYTSKGVFVLCKSTEIAVNALKSQQNIEKVIINGGGGSIHAALKICEHIMQNNIPVFIVNAFSSGCFYLLLNSDCIFVCPDASIRTHGVRHPNDPNNYWLQYSMTRALMRTIKEYQEEGLFNSAAAQGYINLLIRIRRKSIVSAIPCFDIWMDYCVSHLMHINYLQQPVKTNFSKVKNG